jgi:hypothetical protein
MARTVFRQQRIATEKRTSGPQPRSAGASARRHLQASHLELHRPRSVTDMMHCWRAPRFSSRENLRHKFRFRMFKATARAQRASRLRHRTQIRVVGKASTREIRLEEARLACPFGRTLLAFASSYATHQAGSSQAKMKKSVPVRHRLVRVVDRSGQN